MEYTRIHGVIPGKVRDLFFLCRAVFLLIFHDEISRSGTSQSSRLNSFEKALKRLCEKAVRILKKRKTRVDMHA